MLLSKRLQDTRSSVEDEEDDRVRVGQVVDLNFKLGDRISNNNISTIANYIYCKYGTCGNMLKRGGGLGRSKIVSKVTRLKLREIRRRRQQEVIVTFASIFATCSIILNYYSTVLEIYDSGRRAKGVQQNRVIEKPN